MALSTHELQTIASLFELGTFTLTGKDALILASIRNRLAQEYQQQKVVEDKAQEAEKKETPLVSKRNSRRGRKKSK